MSSLPNDPNNARKLLTEYIDVHNLSVIPVNQDKRPIVPSWKEFQQTKMSLTDFENAVRKHSTASNTYKGIALVTGKISGITIVDFDTGSQDILWGTQTPTVQTGSGGKHYYFKYTDKISQGANHELKIDIRNDGGYAIMPPSISIKGKYEWIRNLDTPLAELPQSFIDFYGVSTPKVKVSFEGVSKGGRNQQAVVNAGKFIQMFRNDPVFAWDSFVAWNSRNNPPLDEKELETIFDWCLTKDQTNHKSVAISNISTSIDLSKLSEDEFFGVKEREMLTTGVAEIDKTFKHPAGFYVICANPGTGKGFYALWITRKFYERHEKKSVYFSLEMTEELIRQRLIQAWSDLTEEQVREAIQNKDYTKLRQSKKLVDEKILIVDEFGGSDNSVVTPQNFKKLFDKYYSEGYRVFHFDHLHEIEGANVNDKNQQVTETWAKMFQGICKDHNDIWLFVYAQPNGGAAKKKLIQRDDIAGSKAITQKCEFFLSLNRDVVIDEETGSVSVKNDTRDVFVFLGKNRITSTNSTVFNLYFSPTGNFVGKSQRLFESYDLFMNKKG